MSTSEHVPVDSLTGDHSVIPGRKEAQGDFHRGNIDDGIWICSKNHSGKPGGWSGEAGLRDLYRSFCQSGPRRVGFPTETKSTRCASSRFAARFPGMQGGR